KGGKRYYITFIDDFSRYTKIYLLRTKDEAEHKFLAYKAEVENQLDRKIKRLRSDRGGEYSSTFLKQVCEQAVTTAYDHVLQHEEKLKGGITLGKEVAATSPAVFAVASSQDNTTALAAFTPKLIPSGAPKKFCRYCRKDNHVIEDCLELKWKKKQEQERAVGGPPNSIPNRFAGAVIQGGTVITAGSGLHDSSAPAFTTEELSQLRLLLQSSQ
ncbi:Retrovirus-related Pol polyprotein from transposon TNT 1-94, partial [Linum grandiflorum]